KPIKLGNPEAASHAGITFLSSDRHKEGLFMSLSVRENAALSALPRFAQFGVVRRRVEVQRVEEQRAALAIRTASIDANVASLSGGNQQKLILARSLLANASVVLAEEPTAGVDVGARSEIYRILREVADRGTPVVIVSSDMLELEGLCDRVMVFSRGQVSRAVEFHRRALAEPDVRLAPHPRLPLFGRVHREVKSAKLMP